MIASYSDVSYCFSVIDKCKSGVGVGDSEVQLTGYFTEENCISAVKERYPTANGATMGYEWKAIKAFARGPPTR